MRLQILSDLHYEFIASGSNYGLEASIWSKIKNAQADLTVLAGDTHVKTRGPGLAARMFSGRPVVMVPGNHELYGQVYPHHIKRLQDEAATYENINFLENQAVEIDGIVFLGCCLWTDCRIWQAGPHAGLFTYPETLIDLQGGMNDYSRIAFFDGRRHRQLRPADTIQIHLNSVRWLRWQLGEHQGKKIVVITHHAPSYLSIPETYSQDVMSAAYASHLDELVETSGAILWIHGHNHCYSDYQIGKTRVLCNPKGYPHETGRNKFKPSLVVKV